MPYLLSDLDDRSFLKKRRTDFRGGGLSEYKGGALARIGPPGGALTKPGIPSIPKPRLASRIAYKIGRGVGSLTGRAKNVASAVKNSKIGQKALNSKIGQGATGLARKGFRGAKKVGGAGLNMARQGYSAARSRVGFSRYESNSINAPKLLSYRR